MISGDAASDSMDNPKSYSGRGLKNGVPSYISLIVDVKNVGSSFQKLVKKKFQTQKGHFWKKRGVGNNEFLDFIFKN